MKLTSSHEFAADPHTVHAMLTDEAFLVRVTEAMDPEQIRAHATAEASEVDASFEAPGPVRAFLGDRVRIVQRTTWGAAASDGSREGQASTTVPGAPAAMTSVIRLTPTASGTRVAHEGDLTVSVPLLGRQIERAVAPVFTDTIEIQAREGRAWLAR